MTGKNFKPLLTYRNLLVLSMFLLVSSCKQQMQSGNPDQDSVLLSQNALAAIPEPVSLDLDQIKTRGKLVAIIDNSSTSYFLYKGQPLGFEYELLVMLAKYLDLELECKINTDIIESFRMLNAGEGDLVAHNLTVLNERKKVLSFTEPHYNVKQVLVQRKPENWRDLKIHEIEERLIRNPIDLTGKEIVVKKNSAFQNRLKNLSEEIGGNIIITEEEEDVATETLIRLVAEGKINYTIADDDVASVISTYYDNLDIGTEISLPQQIAWGVRKNAPELLNEINKWLAQIKRRPAFNVVYNKYFKSPKTLRAKVQSDYSSLTGGKISLYDEFIKEKADELGWDWRLLAAQIYRESKFDPDAVSWMGAIGLMQLLPETGQMFGIENLNDPYQNIVAGTSYLKWLDNIWLEKIPDPEERVKFVLASYNVGQGHILDAYRLTEKYGSNANSWDEVKSFLLKKCNKEYFDDPVVETGYCRGDEPVTYVDIILNRYQQYMQLITT